ncbi:hypothetical protein V8E52_010456 [Russula decolorans]
MKAIPRMAGGELEFTSNVPPYSLQLPRDTFHSFVISCRYSMELSANISPTIALAGILSGIFLFALSLLLFHILLQRRKAKAAKSRLGPLAPHGNNHHQQQQASSAASAFSFSPRRRSRSRTSRSDSESDAEEGSEKMMMNDDDGSRASSLYLEPNQPLYVDVDMDVESESNDRASDLIGLVMAVYEFMIVIVIVMPIEWNCTNYAWCSQVIPRRSQAEPQIK